MNETWSAMTILYERGKPSYEVKPVNGQSVDSLVSRLNGEKGHTDDNEATHKGLKFIKSRIEEYLPEGEAVPPSLLEALEQINDMLQTLEN